jgi:ubiquinone/menaquinone biosynthesis C-methylase UbiE
MQRSTDPSPEHRAVVEEYDRLAGIYDTRWSFYNEATARETMRRLRLEPGDRVLDVGCGTGILLGALAAAYSEAGLSGIDASPEMLGVARRRLGDRADLRQGWAHELPWEDRSFDLVVCSSVLHYLRSPEPALAEMRRVLRPAGTVVITDWSNDFLTCRVLDLLLRRFNRAHHRAYRQRQLCDMLRSSDFASARCDRYKINWLWGMMTASASAPRSSQPT